MNFKSVILDDTTDKLIIEVRDESVDIIVDCWGGDHPLYLEFTGEQKEKLFKELKEMMEVVE